MQHWLCLRVSDAGRGMSPEEAARCFDPYQAAARDEGGNVGLGLFNSRQFAALLGGSLSVVSRRGEGSAFTLRVPVRVLPDAEAALLEEDAMAAAATRDEAGSRSSEDEEVLARAAATAPATQPQPPPQPGERRLRALLAGALFSCMVARRGTAAQLTPCVLRSLRR
jgi:hypothetical protein